MQIDHLRTAIAEQVPRLQKWEVDGLAKKLESTGLVRQQLKHVGFVWEVGVGVISGDIQYVFLGPDDQRHMKQPKDWQKAFVIVTDDPT